MVVAVHPIRSNCTVTLSVVEGSYWLGAVNGGADLVIFLPALYSEAAPCQ
jgi:hypothetical protein